MASYYPFFGGAATVAGALIGLLFVALSLSPERLRDAASLEHQAIAATAFTALVDALFVSASPSGDPASPSGDPAPPSGDPAPPSGDPAPAPDDSPPAT